MKTIDLNQFMLNEDDEMMMDNMKNINTNNFHSIDIIIDYICLVLHNNSLPVV